MLTIKLWDNVDAEVKNEILKGLNFDEQKSFWTENDNKLWLDDVNNNPNSYQRHWKPEDRDLTMDELVELAGVFGKVQELKSDLYFGRTSENDMQLLAEFIVNNKEDIEYVDGVDLLLERGNIKKEYHSIIQTLEKPYNPPEKYPEEEQHIPDLQGGQLLCKTWSDKPFYVTFGKVDSPKFLKEKIYKDDILNNLYRDDKGYAYLLIPLNNMSEGFADRVYEEAWQLGLREHPNFFIPFLYHYSITDFREVGKTFSTYYTKDELLERLLLVLKDMKPELNFMKEQNRNSLIINRHGYFKWQGNDLILSKHKLELLNSLTYALKQHCGTLYSYDIEKGKFVFKRGVIEVSAVTV